MKLEILEKEQIYSKVAGEIANLIHEKPNCVLGLATGSTPIGIYEQLIKLHKNNGLSFRTVKTYNLDEYIGLNPNHDQSYAYFMNRNLFNHIDIDKNNVHIPDGINYNDAIKNYDLNIASDGGIDLQILGIGSNGHIAFNEPGTSLNTLTHIVKLKDSTRKDNSRFFSSIEKVPTHAITMGLASIIRAKRIVLIATGENKKDAIYRLFNEEISKNLPASILKIHPNVTIYCDQDAAKLIK